MNNWSTDFEAKTAGILRAQDYPEWISDSNVNQQQPTTYTTYTRQPSLLLVTPLAFFPQHNPPLETQGYSTLHWLVPDPNDDPTSNLLLCLGLVCAEVLLEGFTGGSVGTGEGEGRLGREVVKWGFIRYVVYSLNRLCCLHDIPSTS